MRPSGVVSIVGVAAGLGVGLAVALGGGGGGSSGDDSPDVDVCRLLTDSEVEAVLGAPPAERTEDTEIGFPGRYCAWDTAEGGLGGRLVVWVEPAEGFEDARQVAERRAASDAEASFEPLELGDGGWIQYVEGSWEVEARRGDRLIRVLADGDRDAVVALAEKAVARLAGYAGPSRSAAASR